VGAVEKKSTVRHIGDQETTSWLGQDVEKEREMIEKKKNYQISSGEPCRSSASKLVDVIVRGNERGLGGKEGGESRGRDERLSSRCMWLIVHKERRLLGSSRAGKGKAHMLSGGRERERARSSKRKDI